MASSHHEHNLLPPATSADNLKKNDFRGNIFWYQAGVKKQTSQISNEFSPIFGLFAQLGQRSQMQLDL
jgi:hypothetical protein